ncbi:hypothetical protein [Ruegeria sp. SCP11]|uniref:hypothetical protein n=1 Tax=Ruegeria sp. SCP11 TaxID=3141378 RepID=UPI00333C0D03
MEQQFEIGDTFLHPTHSRRQRCHVRGFVDGLLVARWWRLSRQYWQYEVFDLDALQLPAKANAK